VKKSDGKKACPIASDRSADPEIASGHYDLGNKARAETKQPSNQAVSTK
jgi:hypothetical protein